MLVRCVVDHEIHDQPHPPTMDLCDQVVEIIKTPEHGIDRLIVADVIAVVVTR
jgi:hypothetical protein